MIAQALALYRRTPGVNHGFATGPFVDLWGHQGTGLAATVGSRRRTGA